MSVMPLSACNPARHCQGFAGEQVRLAKIIKQLSLVYYCMEDGHTRLPSWRRRRGRVAGRTSPSIVLPIATVSCT